MAEKGFFGGLQKGIAQGTQLALKKLDMDMAKERFDMDVGLKLKDMLLREKKYEQEKLEDIRKIKVDEISDLVKMSETPGIGQSDLAEIDERVVKLQTDLGVHPLGLPKMEHVGPPTREGVFPEGGFVSTPSPEEQLRMKAQVDAEYDKPASFIEYMDPDGTVTRFPPDVDPGPEYTRIRTGKEREEQRMRSSVDRLSTMALENPDKFHEDQHYRQNDDGSLFLDPITRSPVPLDPNWTKYLGKRTNVVTIKALGEQWNDAKELADLLALQEVKDSLREAQEAGHWDIAKGKWKNTITKWMQTKGFSKDSNTATAIARIQRLASEERKRFLGAAVTPTELQSVLAWMPDAGDSFDTIVNKTRLMGQEAEQEFRRWLSLYENITDMSPFYKAFGIKRFADREEVFDIPRAGASALPDGIPIGSKKLPGKSKNGYDLYVTPSGKTLEYIPEE
jgi:hypothetical protein